MQKVLLTVFFLMGIQLLSIAQDATDSIQPANSVRRTFYVSLGAAFNGNYNLDEKLKASNWPNIKSTIPEISIGYNISGKKYLADIEFNAGYTNGKVGNNNRLSTVALGLKLRGHYVPVRTDSFYFTIGADVSYLTNTINLYNNNIIDVNNLNIGYNGHISLFNEWLYTGPSVAFGLFQTYDIPLRLNMGYEWAVTNGYWTSNFSEVVNSLNESGHNRFYAKVTFYL